MSRYYTPPVIDPRDCNHPDRYLRYNEGLGHYNWRHHVQLPKQNAPSMHCLRCNSVVVYVNDETDFVKQRELKFTSETGLPVVPRDMLGNEISVGSIVVYPRPGNTMGTGMVEAIDHTNTISDWDRAMKPRVDAPLRIKVAPSEWNSKRMIEYTNRRADGNPKTITLVEGAPSAVVVG
jgi:hypothetical protein